MASSHLARVAGVAGVIAGLAYAATGIVDRLGPLYPRSFTSLSHYLVQYVFLAALVGSIVTVAGLHALQRGRYGWVGTVGASVTVIGNLLFSYGTIEQIVAGASVGPGIQTVGFWFTLGGLVILGIATLQARLLPLWCGVVLVMGFPILWVLGPPLGTALGTWLPIGIYLGLFWAVLGYALLSSNFIASSWPSHRPA
jgi:hypothetical protein